MYCNNDNAFMFMKQPESNTTTQLYTFQLPIYSLLFASSIFFLYENMNNNVFMLVDTA